jgi:hypothetical protein
MPADPQSNAGHPRPRKLARMAGEVDVSEDELLGMLRPYPARRMRAYPVDRRIRNVRNHDPGLLAGIAAAAYDFVG